MADSVINVLFTLHPGVDALDFVGALEVLSKAQHNKDDEGESIGGFLRHCSRQV